VLLNPGQSGAAAQSIHDFTVQQYGEDVSMSKYKGEVLVVVNVASE
jgi:glutathione peroxidase-family protein